MKIKQVHKKPIGENGPVRVINMGGQPDVEWRKIDYPPEKRPQELAVATSFVAALNNTESSVWELTALQENDFDFEMRSQDGKRYLELQEVVIPGKKRGPPYADREQVIYSSKFAETILSENAKKVAKYSLSLDQPLDLLLYNTHWRFLPNNAVFQLVAYAFRNKKHPFSRVYFSTRLDKTAGHITNAGAVPITRGNQIGAQFNLSQETLRKLREP